MKVKDKLKLLITHYKYILSGGIKTLKLDKESKAYFEGRLNMLQELIREFEKWNNY